MRCRRVERLLSDYIDGCLSESQRIIIEEHLKGCSLCRASLKRLEDTLALIKIKAAESPSEAYWNRFWPRLRSRLEERDEGKAPVPCTAPVPIFVRQPLLALTAFAVIVLATLFIFNAIMFESGEKERHIRFALRPEGTHELARPGRAIPQFPSRGVARERDFIVGADALSRDVDEFVLKHAALRGSGVEPAGVHYVLAQATRQGPGGSFPVIY